MVTGTGWPSATCTRTARVHVEVHAATVASADSDSCCEVAHILPRTAGDGG